MACFANAAAANITTDQSTLFSLRAYISHHPHNVLTSNWSRSTSLNIKSNSFSGSLPENFARLYRTNKLSSRLQMNMFDNLPNLLHFSITCNQFSGELPSTLYKCKQLQILSLSYNNFMGRFLGLLNLASNNLTIESSTPKSSFFSTLSNLKYLEMLLLSANPLNGIFPSHYNINGNISREISNLSSLTTLLLDNNQFAGPIPTTTGKLHKLEAIYLQNNKLEGSIPPDLCNLESLVELNLATFNQLTSMVPLSSWNITYILDVNLSSNLLDGYLSIEMGNMKVLRILDLPRNYLEFLDLSNKKLSGKIPKSLEALLYLKYLNVSFNRLQGKILREDHLKTSQLYHLCQIRHFVVLHDCKFPHAFKIFDVECEVLRNTRHKNLIKIINICSNIEFKALVLEYMPNGNLEKWLYSHNHYLNILQKLNIMSRGLVSGRKGGVVLFPFPCFSFGVDVFFYLWHKALVLIHFHLEETDGIQSLIYSSVSIGFQILLFLNLFAHVADFGMAKLLGDGDSMISNMYSYGILLMETFTRKRPTDDIFSKEMSLKSWIEESLLVLSVTDIIDDNLLSNESDDASMEELMYSIMRLTLDYCVESPKQRINIKNVSDALRKIKLKFLQHLRAQGN
ncbi:hypothetical protein I3843_09G130200 [Carya illinoinensis]|nr:hypothetical protein I3843_09G130200 [Carya illinoinensis]